MSISRHIILRLNTLASTYNRSSSIDVRCRMGVTLVYIIVVLMVPLYEPSRLLWLFCYPIIMAEVAGVGYGRLLLQSLAVLPFVALVGMFNPIIDRQPMFEMFGVVISSGWVSFITILLRGILTFQALILLVESHGFIGICVALQRMHCPSILVTQLFMLYRYIGLVMQEALDMHRARVARGFGKRAYSLKMWTTFVGQLLLRSVNRASRINRAMVARGFEGRFTFNLRLRPISMPDILFFVGWSALFIALRYIDLTTIVSNLLA